MTTTRDEAVEKAAAFSTDSGPPMRSGAASRARQLAHSVTVRVRTVLRALGFAPGAADDDVGRLAREIVAAPPPSLATLYAYTQAGEWVPGEQARVLELAGKVYGYAVALPLSAALYAVSLLIQRPARLAFAAFVVGVVLLVT